MICEICGELILEGDEMNYMGKVLCEDCYIDAVSLPKTCDVAAVYSAKWRCAYLNYGWGPRIH